MPNKDYVTIQLVGGLGNQLFGYFAGRYIANRLGVELRLDMSQFDQGITAHGSDIRSFRLSESVQTLPIETRFTFFFWKTTLLALAEKFPPVKPLVERTLAIHTSIPVGRDPEIEGVRPGMLVRGYFQTYLYAQEVTKDTLDFSLDLREPSEWFTTMASKISLNPPIMIHIRRGDYAKPENSGFGMLAIDYYLSALQRARKNGNQDAPVWVFTDDVALISKEISGLIDGEVLLVEPPAGADPAESLILMSLGCVNVISNSTFSWWSAMLNRNSTVIAPTKWFRDMKDPDGLIPPNWLLEESIWK